MAPAFGFGFSSSHGRGGSPGPNGSPSNLVVVTNSDTSQTLTWTIGSTNQDGCHIYDSSNALVATVTGSTATKTLTGLTANTQYGYYVKIYKGALESAKSSTVYATTYHAELGVYITGLSTELSTTQKGRINTLISSLKTGLSVTNLSDFFDVFVLLAGETQESALKNLVKNAHHATIGGSPTFTQFEGFTGNGTNAYLNSHYNAKTQKVNYAQDDNAYGIYIRNNVDEAKCEIGIKMANLSSLLQCRSGNLAFYFNNVVSVGNYGQAVNTNSVGFYINTRDGNLYTDEELYKNKTKPTQSHSGTNSTSGIPDGNIFVLAVNIDTAPNLFCTKQASAYFYSKHVTPTQRDIIVDAVETYMLSNGKGAL